MLVELSVNMARPLRIEYEGAWYHVYSRGAGRRRVYFGDDDYASFMDLLGEILELWNVQTHAFSLMPNHYHLVIHTPSGQLSRALRHLNGVYTQRFNKRHKTDGPLFKGRFRARVVEKENYLLELVRYIHFNPIKAGICEDPSKHKWTSHFGYLNRSKKPSWLYTNEVLSYFGGQKKRAVTKFDFFVKEKMVGKADDQISFAKFPAVLGTLGFREWVKHNFIDGAAISNEINDKKRVTKKRVTYNDVLKCIRAYYHVDTASIRESIHGRSNDPRRMAIYLLRKLTGASHAEIARQMGGRGNYAIAKTIQRMNDNVKNDKTLMKIYESLSMNILSNVKI